jgi:hypothetical protein
MAAESSFALRSRGGDSFGAARDHGGCRENCVKRTCEAGPAHGLDVFH